MKRTTITITAIVLTIGIAGGAAAFGKHKFGDPEKRAAHVVNYISEELSLDSAQQQALNVLKDEMMATRTLMRDQMTPLRQEVETLISEDRFDQDRALELITSKTAIMNKAAPTMVAAFGNFLDSLNAEQKTEVLEFVEHRREHGRHRHHYN